MNGTAAVGASGKAADASHVHPSDTTKANLASPTFSGAPKIGTSLVAVVAANTGVGDTNMPVGSYIVMDTENGGNVVIRNGAIVPYLKASDNYYYVSYSGGTQLSGTWRSCGGVYSGTNSRTSYLLRRVA
jgi:hypothetical protein